MELKLTTNHNGKMSGLQSLSTNVRCNHRCEENAKIEGSICSHCYASTMAKMYSRLDKVLTDNTEILTTRYLLPDELPIISSLYFRFEAFGDLMNDIQVMNYFNICNVNPDVNFAIWTKNPDIIDAVLKNGLVKKPENLKIIVSSLMMNQVRNIEKYRYFVDHVFTVYSLDYLKSHQEIKINCGSRSCLKCHQCYSHRGVQNFYINELLKSDQKKKDAELFEA